MLPGMLDWLETHMTHYAGHEEGRIFMVPDFFVALYNGDGCWHLFKRDAATMQAGFTFESARATGVGLNALKCSLGLEGWTAPKPR
jgi:hypothetical protein